MLKLAVAATSGNAEYLSEFLSLERQDLTVRLGLEDLAAALTADLDLSPIAMRSYAQAFEAACVLGIYRRSADPQRLLRGKFATALRFVSKRVNIHPSFVTAMLAVSVNDAISFNQHLLKLATDEAGVSPVVAAGL